MSKKRASCSATHSVVLVALFSLIGLMYKSEHIFSEDQIRLLQGDGMANHVGMELPAYSQKIPKCVCSRRLMYPPPSGWAKSSDSNKSEIFIKKGDFSRLNSSCSDEGTRYQSGQNVISLSLWLSPNAKPVTIKNYQLGILQNLEMMREYYPGYSLRLYTNLKLSVGDFFCETLCKNQDMFWCDIQHTPSHGNLSGKVFSTWRFLPLGDPTVNIFHSRDLDSLITAREAAVEKDWLSRGDNKTVMLMRDRQGGHDVPILAGMWGAHNVRLGMSFGGELREKLFNRTIEPKDQGKSKLYDQHVLNNVIFYPLARKKILVAYDSYSCVKYSKYTEVRPFPTKRFEGYFVGKQIDYSGLSPYWFGRGKHECPVECRPDYGKDWVYC